MQTPKGSKVVEISALRRRRHQRKQGLANAVESALMRCRACDCGSLCCCPAPWDGKCDFCGRVRQLLVHYDPGVLDEPCIFYRQECVPVSDLLDLLGDTDISYSWVREAPWLFQLLAICFACVRAGKRIERCFETRGGWGFHDYRDKDGKTICIDCGDDADAEPEPITIEHGGAVQ